MKRKMSEESSLITTVKNEPGVCGLNNLWNTCYLNSALQCLSSVQILTDFVISSEELFQEKSLIDVYRKLIRDMWSGMHSSISPNEFRDTLSNLFPEFGGYGQKDCCEVITKILDQFHEELMIKNLESGTQIGEYKTFEDYLKNNDTFVAHNFQGFRRTKMFCECKHIFHENCEPFFFLDLPQLETQHMIETCSFFNHHYSINKYSTVEDCLRNYLATNKVDGTMFCSGCQKDVVPYTKSELLYAPNVLILKLKTDPTKQYQWNFSGCIFKQTLNFEPYLINGRPTIYELTAIANYSGSSRFGHYTTYAKNNLNNKWYHFNDHKVDEINESQLCSRQSYLLIYCKSMTQ